MVKFKIGDTIRVHTPDVCNPPEARRGAIGKVTYVYQFLDGADVKFPGAKRTIQIFEKKPVLFVSQVPALQLPL